MLSRSSLLRMFCSNGSSEASRSSSALRRSRCRFDGLLLVTPSLGGGFRLRGGGGRGQRIHAGLVACPLVMRCVAFACHKERSTSTSPQPGGSHMLLRHNRTHTHTHTHLPACVYVCYCGDATYKRTLLLATRKSGGRMRACNIHSPLLCCAPIYRPRRWLPCVHSARHAAQLQPGGGSPPPHNRRRRRTSI